GRAEKVEAREVPPPPLICAVTSPNVVAFVLIMRNELASPPPTFDGSGKNAGGAEKSKPMLPILPTSRSAVDAPSTPTGKAGAPIKPARLFVWDTCTPATPWKPAIDLIRKISSKSKGWPGFEVLTT